MRPTTAIPQVPDLPTGFSTVNAADRVLVLADQQLAEYGMHDELIAAGHLYAELYDLLARSYQA